MSRTKSVKDQQRLRKPIKTSHLVAQINRQKLVESYSVFCVKTTNDYFRYGATILDTPLLSEHKLALSVVFDRGKRFYVLTRKEVGIKQLLKDTVQADESDGGKVSVTECYIEDETGEWGVSEWVLVRLLLASLAVGQGKMFSFNNTSGHLYCIVPRKSSGERSGKDSFVRQIVCVEVAVTQELKLTLDVKTFSNVKLAKEMNLGKEKLKDYPQYVFSPTHFTLRRKMPSDRGQGQECFIMHQIMKNGKQARSTVPFFDFTKTKTASSVTSFYRSKMGILDAVLTRFRERYEGVCDLDFERVAEYTAIDNTKERLNESKEVVAAVFGAQQTLIVNMVADSEGEQLCFRVQGLLKEMWGVDAPIVPAIWRDALNICCIHNEAYYDECDDRKEEDPHDTYTDTAVQHITIEDFGKNPDMAIATVVHNVLIKHDLLERRITLFDWGQLNLSENVVFGWRKKPRKRDRKVNDDSCRLYFMRVSPDGAFLMSERNTADSLDAGDEYHECVTAFCETDDAVALVMRSGGVNVILEADLFTLPEESAIREELEAGNTSLRGLQKRDEHLSSIVDIKTYRQGDALYYLVGTVGDGMQARVPTASHIRCVKPFGDAPLMFDDLLPLMNVTFVRDGRLTVIPFPFKYLREWAVQAGGGKQEGREE